MRRALLFVVAAATVLIALSSDAGKVPAMFAMFVMGAAVALEVRRALDERDQARRDARKAALAEVEHVDDEVEVDEPRAWPAPQTPRLEDRERYAWRGEGSPRYARAAARVSLAVVDEHRLDRDEWAARPVDEAWQRAARAVEHEGLALRLNRWASGWIDDLIVIRKQAQTRLILWLAVVRAWLALHEPSFGWTKRVGTHALELMPAAAPVREIVTGEQRVVVRFVDVDDGRVLDLAVAHILTDTAEWRVPSEWLYEPVGAVVK